MGTIRKILEKELVKGGTSAEVYPITHTRAVFNDSNVSVEELLKEAHLDTLLNNYRLSGMADSVNSRGSEYYKGVPCFIYALPSGYYPNFLDAVYHTAMGLDRGITVSTAAIFSIFTTNDGVYWSSLEVPYKVIDNLTSTNSTIPLSAAQGKVLKDLIDNSIKASNPYSVVNQTKTTATIEPNVYNLWSTPVTSLTISLASNADTTVMPEYVFEFTAALTGWTGLTFTDAANIYLSGDFTIVGGGTHQISIVNGIAIMAKV